MHIHTLSLDIPRSTDVFCSGCDIALRLATYDEATFVQTTGAYADDGPMIFNDNMVIVVPKDFSVSKVA